MEIRIIPLFSGKIAVDLTTLNLLVVAAALEELAKTVWLRAIIRIRAKEIAAKRAPGR